MTTVIGLLMAAVLALGSGCTTRSDWIERTLVTVDVTGSWQGSSSGREADERSRWTAFSLDLQQQGPKVIGSGRAFGGPDDLWRRLRTGTAIEGTIAGDVFRSVTGTLAASG
jgi:hypothetical protein